jgi:ABC-type branched-subunit amino acid transport system substrate-binding protein
MAVRNIAGVLVAASFALWLGGCASSTPDLASKGTSGLPDKPALGAGARAEARSDVRPEQRATVKVALLLPLSGPGQTGLIADSMKRAAELAVFEPNAQHVQLIIRDDKGTPEGAVSAAQEVLGQGAELILGPLLSGSVSAAQPVARSKNVPMIAFSNDKQAAGPNVHLLSFMVAPEVQRVIAYASAKGRKRIIALVPDDAYGRIIEASLREAAARNGAQIVAFATYPAQANGMLAAVRQLRDEVRGIEEHGDPVDALFIPAGEEALASLAPQLRQAGFDMSRIKVLGTGALDYPNAGRDPLIVGAWFAAPDPSGWKDFSAKYAKAHGHAPPRIASLAFDAVGVAAALGSGPEGARFIPSALTRANGFTGVDGLFRLTQDGTADRALAVLEVQAFGSTVIEPPASSFSGAGQAAVMSNTRMN